MRYDGARLADFSVSGDTKRRQSFDGAFFTLSMLLLLIGVIMVLSSSYARAYYDPGNVTGGNRRVLFRAAAYLRTARNRLHAAGV